MTKIVTSQANLTTRGGRIRFQGGPLHNQVLPVTPLTPEQVVVAPPLQEILEASQRDDRQLENPNAWRHRYRLVNLVSATGCRWLEYHLERE